MLLHLCSLLYVDVCSVRDLRLTVIPVSTRVYEASLIARLIGRLEIERAEIVYADIGNSRLSPTETSTEQLNCTFTSQLLHRNCSHQAMSQNFSITAANPLLSVAMATNEAVSQLMTKSAAVWDKLSEKSRNFLQSTQPLHAAIAVNASIYVTSRDYSTVIDELMFLLPVPPRDVTLPRLLLCVDCETALFASISGLLTLASAQHATGSQCLLGHVFYACGRLSAVERFYFRSNWSRVESQLKDVRYCYSDSTIEQLYADTTQHVFAAISASIQQSRACTTVDNASRWYSACKQMLSGTDRIMESLIVENHRTVAAVWQRCVLEIVIYAFLICIQVCFVNILIFTCVSYAEARNSYRLDVRLSVCLSVRPSVRHTLAPYQNG